MRADDLVVGEMAGGIGEVVDKPVTVVVFAVADLALWKLSAFTISPAGLEAALCAVLTFAASSGVVGACVTSASLAFFTIATIVDQAITIVVEVISADVLCER